MEVIQGKPPGMKLDAWLTAAGVSLWHWQHMDDAERPQLVIISKTIFSLEEPSAWFQRMLEAQKDQPKRLRGRAGAGRPKKAASDV
jgi:hypothetical protein